MAIGLPEGLWKRAGEGQAARRAVSGRKAVDKNGTAKHPVRSGKDWTRGNVASNRTFRRMITRQDEAIDQIVNIYQMNLTGMSAPGRPIGNFLFLGPTGSGKTRIVEAYRRSAAEESSRGHQDRLRGSSSTVTRSRS